MAADISGVGGPNHSPEINPPKFKNNYMSAHLEEMKTAVMEETQYLVLDPNQIHGMVKSIGYFSQFGDEHFNNAYQNLESHVSQYRDAKNQDPAFKLTSIAKNQIEEAGQAMNNVSIKLEPDQFATGIRTALQAILSELDKGQMSAHDWAEHTGMISNFCNLPTFSSDQLMNELFFDMSTHTMDPDQVPQTHIKEGIEAILKAL